MFGEQKEVLKIFVYSDHPKILFGLLDFCRGFHDIMEISFENIEKGKVCNFLTNLDRKYS